jgi:hypothetical protein
MDAFIFIAYILVELMKVLIIMGVILNNKITQDKYRYFLSIMIIIICTFLAYCLGYNRLINHPLAIMLINMLIVLFLFKNNYIKTFLSFITIYFCTASIDAIFAKIVAILLTDSHIILNVKIWTLTYNLVGLIVVDL